MTMDNNGHIYYGDMENSAILRINTEEKPPTIDTLFKNDKLLRWPDGFSFGIFLIQSICFLFLFFLIILYYILFFK